MDINELVNKIYMGDSIKILQNLPSSSIDLIFTDPPFNLGKDYGESVNDNLSRDEYIQWVKEWLTECCRILKDTGSIYIMNIQRNVWIFQKFLEQDFGFKFQNIVTWKNSSLPVKNRFCIHYQPIVFYTKTDKYTFNFKVESREGCSHLPWGRENKGNLMIDQWDDIPFISGGCIASKEAILEKNSKKKVHPCQMPITLAERVIKFSSNENDIVLDPFVGIGATAIAAKKLGRKYIGIDKNKRYCEFAERRLENTEMGWSGNITVDKDDNISLLDLLEE